MSALFSPTALVVPFENLRMTDVEAVGGKNASLGEMISQLPQGVRVPTGFATTAHAFRQFLAHDGLAARINARLDTLDTEDVRALAQVGAEIRAMVEAQPFPPEVEQGIRGARLVFPRVYIDKLACESPDPQLPGLVECLKRYRRQVNQQTQTPGAPLHDVHSNGADAFRYLSLVADQMTNETWGGALNYKRLTTT